VTSVGGSVYGWPGSAADWVTLDHWSFAADGPVDGDDPVDGGDAAAGLMPAPEPASTARCAQAPEGARARGPVPVGPMPVAAGGRPGGRGVREAGESIRVVDSGVAGRSRRTVDSGSGQPLSRSAGSGGGGQPCVGSDAACSDAARSDGLPIACVDP